MELISTYLLLKHIQNTRISCVYIHISLSIYIYDICVYTCYAVQRTCSIQLLSWVRVRGPLLTGGKRYVLIGFTGARLRLIVLTILVRVNDSALVDPKHYFYVT